MLLICPNHQIDVLYPKVFSKLWEYLVSGLNKKNQRIPVRLVALTALFSICLAMLAVFTKKDSIEISLMQDARKALSAAGLPLVGVEFEGRVATLTGSVAGNDLVEEVAAAVQQVFGVRKVVNQLKAKTG